MVMTGKRFDVIIPRDGRSSIELNRDCKVDSEEKVCVVEFEFDDKVENSYNIYYYDTITGAIFQTSRREGEEWSSFLSRFARRFNSFFKATIEVIYLKENNLIKLPN